MARHRVPKQASEELFPPAADRSAAASVTLGDIRAGRFVADRDGQLHPLPTASRDAVAEDPRMMVAPDVVGEVPAGTMMAIGKDGYLRPAGTGAMLKHLVNPADLRYVSTDTRDFEDVNVEARRLRERCGAGFHLDYVSVPTVEWRSVLITWNRIIDTNTGGRMVLTRKAARTNLIEAIFFAHRYEDLVDKEGEEAAAGWGVEQNKESERREHAAITRKGGS